MQANLAVLLAATCLFGQAGKSTGSKAPVDRAREIERQIHTLINRERAKEGARPLRWNGRLAAAARNHSRRMAEAGFFAHEDPRHGALRQRLDRARISWSMIAENISYARDRRATLSRLAADAVKRWMQSDGHRDNLLEPRYTDTGIGAAFSSNGALHMTQIFLRP